jgi:hypothetical protein
MAEPLYYQTMTELNIWLFSTFRAQLSIKNFLGAKYSSISQIR